MPKFMASRQAPASEKQTNRKTDDKAKGGTDEKGAFRYLGVGIDIDHCGVIECQAKRYGAIVPG